jgi:guanosine-3',5'-bis(diphosphate) 3'-pyrophosphohydrolase
MSHATTELLRALRFAAHRHRRQQRKDAEQSPYVNHLIDVAALLAEEGSVTDVPTLVAAVLHDTIEDTDTTPEELERAFGGEVRRLVEELTDDKRLPRQRRKELQVERAPAASGKAKLIRLADKISNVSDLTLSPPPDWPPERRRAYFDWSDAVVAGLRGTNPALEARYDRVAARAHADVDA